MRIPSRNAGTYKICEAFYYHKKPVTLDEGIALHGYTGLPKRHVMQSLYTNMCDAGYIIEVDGVFSLSPHMVRYFDGCGQKVEVEKTENVLPRYHPKFKEMRVVPHDPRLSSTAYRTSGTIEEPLIRNYTK